MLMILLYIVLAYLAVGFVWGLFATFRMFSIFSDTANFFGCLITNTVFWPLILLLACSFHNWDK